MNRTFVSDLREQLGSPSSETVEGLRLLRAFVKLSSRQRSEIIELVERFRHRSRACFRRYQRAAQSALSAAGPCGKNCSQQSACQEWACRESACRASAPQEFKSPHGRGFERNEAEKQRGRRERRPRCVRVSAVCQRSMLAAVEFAGVSVPTRTIRRATCASRHDAAGSGRSGCQNARKPFGHPCRKADGSRSFPPLQRSEPGGCRGDRRHARDPTTTAMAVINGFKIIRSPV
jgi:hypothetical protein